MQLSVVIPARNEAQNIVATLSDVCQVLTREQISYEIVVVDDGSTDDTVQVVALFAREYPTVRVVENTGPHGFGYAIRKGLEEYAGDAVVIVMADGSDDPKDIVSYYYILRDRADCAFGSRWIRGSQVVDYPWFKLIVNRMANTFIQGLFGLPHNDITNAFKGYRRYVIDACQPMLSPHFNLTVEIPLKAIIRGYSYATTPISWRNRKYGVSSLKIEEMGSRYLYIVLNLWLERALTRNDYRRAESESFVPWTPEKTAEQSAAPTAPLS